MSDELPDTVSEAPAPYGTMRRKAGKRIVVTKKEMKKMTPPFPAEPEWVAELSAEAERRRRLKADSK